MIWHSTLTAQSHEPPARPPVPKGLRARLKGHREHIRELAFSPDSKLLASSSTDCTLRLWDVSARKQVAAFRELSNSVGAFVFTPDGRFLVAFGGVAGTEGGPLAVVYDIKRRKLVRQFTPRKGVGQPLCLTPDGKTLILAGWGTEASLVDLATGKEVATLPGKRVPRAMALSRDGKRLAVANVDGTLLIWDLPTRKRLHTLTDVKSVIHCLAFSPDGKELSAGHGSGVTTWSVGEEPEVKRTILLFRLTMSAQAIAYSPDGKTLAIVGFKPGLVLWDLKAGRPRADFDGRTREGHNTAVAFSPDGRTIATGGEIDKDVLLWDAPPPRKAGKE